MTGRRLVAVLCLTEVLGMAGFGAFAALLPIFKIEWGLSNAAAGWIEGAFQAGYLVGVPLLVGLTDRVDPRQIYLVSMAAAAFASLGFALLADGLWSACLFRALAGFGLAGTYMPGLRLLSERLEGPAQSRAVALYTASFSVGVSLSVFLAGALNGAFGWRPAFAVAGACAATALLISAASLAGARPSARPARSPAALLDFRPVLANRETLAYSLGYAAHMWELFGFRAWIVAFLVFAQGRAAGDLPAGLSATGAAALVLVLALPASLLGNEASLRYGRRRTLLLAMGASAIVAGVVGLSAAMPLFAMLAVMAAYGAIVGADSASLTAGAVAGARAGQEGLTMSFHTLVGFAAAAVSPLAFGAVLDAGGDDRLASWWLAFAVLGLGVALGPLCLWWLRPKGAS
jgi:MFS family permease